MTSYQMMSCVGDVMMSYGDVTEMQVWKKCFAHFRSFLTRGTSESFRNGLLPFHSGDPGGVPCSSRPGDGSLATGNAGLAEVRGAGRG